MYFYGLLTKTPQEFSFDDLLNTIERLQIITIELDNNDDAQLIFESLNSTGLALTEADKIRNYLLMSLSPEEQQQCFKDYWQKIDLALTAQKMGLNIFIVLEMPSELDVILERARRMGTNEVNKTGIPFKKW